MQFRVIQYHVKLGAKKPSTTHTTISHNIVKVLFFIKLKVKIYGK